VELYLHSSDTPSWRGAQLKEKFPHALDGIVQSGKLLPTN